jgi:hypothetical protein|uniref:Uncharacterized protein n=1 Tax=viral metagenome TaxID=1070528 RepID=A0A6C0CYV8_9ZZZZ
MGRFDSLKDNHFNSNNEKNNKKRNNKREKESKIKKEIPERFKMENLENNLDKVKYDRNEQVNKREIIKKEKKVEQIQAKQIQVEQIQVEQIQVEEPKKESEWIKRIKKTEEKTIPLTDINNPIYWDGPIWNGPIYLKGDKIGEKWTKYIDDANKLSSSIIIPNLKTKWSRDGLNWYNSYDETFSPEHLQAIEDYKWEKEMEKFRIRNMELHEKRREESERNYWETGEIDSFMWAEIEHEKYEKYCAALEKEWEEAEKALAEEEKEEEYLEEEED